MLEKGTDSADPVAASEGGLMNLPGQVQKRCLTTVFWSGGQVGEITTVQVVPADNGIPSGT